MAVLGSVFPFLEGNCGFRPHLERMNDAAFFKVLVIFGTIIPCAIHML